MKKHCGITRAKADELVGAIAERAASFHHPMIELEKLEVFGSYLTDKPKLGDIDLVLSYRTSDLFRSHLTDPVQMARALEDGPLRRWALKSWWNSLTWPQKALVSFLRDGHPAFSFHEPCDIADDWPRRVLFQKSAPASSQVGPDRDQTENLIP